MIFVDSWRCVRDRSTPFDERPLGAGEASQGPAAAAIANAFADATGKRMRELPLTAERVKAVLRA